LEDRRAEWLNGFVAAAAPHAALAVAVVAGVLVPVNALLLPPELVVPLTASVACTSIANAVLWLAIRRRPVPPRLAHPLAAAVAGSLLAGIALFLSLVPEARHTTTLMLVSVAGGGLLTSRRWLALHLGAALAAFAVGALSASSDTEWLHFGVALTFAFAVSVLLQEMRLRVLFRLWEARADLEHEFAERTRAEAALRDGEARFRMIFEHAPVMMYSIDRDGRLVAVNDKWLEELCYAREDVLGRSVTAVLAPESAEHAVREGLPQLWRDGAVRAVDLRMLRRDGSLVEVQLDATVIPGPGGAPVGLSVLRNVGASKRAAADRERLRQQLFEARKLEGLGLLAGGIAHDFNNLLATILGNAHLSLEALPAEHGERAALAEIRDAAERGRLLTRQLLSYAGRAPAVRVPVDLAEQVRGVAALVQRSLPARVALRFDLADSLAAVEVDPGQLQQVIMNLLRNAADALGRAGGEIVVRTSLTRLERAELAGLVAGGALEPGLYVRLDVADDGCGMDAETRERLFDPFFTSKESGHGLGLPVALGVVRAHGGGIAVESEPGVGTTFRVYLPASSRAPVEQPSEDAHALRGSGRVLLADDDVAVRGVVRRMLERLGYRVAEASDGVTAQECARETSAPFDAAVIDLRMPGGGLESARALRELDPELPVLLVSGFDADGALEQVGIDGAVAFLAKPFVPRELAEALRALIASGQRKRREP
jgi:PAS domain S-box-containing protein